MAGASLLTLIDDIATLLDDVAVMSKVAMTKTAGVLGDDLALNAEQVAGVKAERELPVVWAVAVGSLKNKAILVPAALVISYFASWLITPLLMLGGGYLCFEGFEKLYHKFFHSHHADAGSHGADSDKADSSDTHAINLKALVDPTIDVVALEKSKIKGAIRTDFILSAEIIVITLGTLKESTFSVQVAVLIAVALMITAGVYGLVAGIVKLDDVGLYLTSLPKTASMAGIKHSVGRGILNAAPFLMRALGIAGTVAMFLVGGGIIMHGIPPLYEMIHHAEESIAKVSGLLAWFAPLVAEGLTGILSGALLLLGYSTIKRIF